jgi:hypothetical protein
MTEEMKYLYVERKDKERTIGGDKGTKQKGERQEERLTNQLNVSVGG